MFIVSDISFCDREALQKASKVERESGDGRLEDATGHVLGGGGMAVCLEEHEKGVYLSRLRSP